MASRNHGGCRKCSSSVEVISVLRDFRRTKKFCDITLKCGERNFYAHCCVLASVSPYFLAMFRSGMSEVYTQVKSVDLAFLSVSPSSVSIVLDYIYGEVIQIDMENAVELLAVADYMLLSQLKNELCEYLCENLSLEKPDLCFATRRYAEMYGCKKLYENATYFIKVLFYRLSQTAAFCGLSLEELESFLECDDLSANDGEVFESILRWVSYSLETRENFLSQLVNDYVHRQSVSPEFCCNILACYGFKCHLLDLFDEEFFKTTDTLDLEYCLGRQGQEVILVFDNKKSQAYTPGLMPWHSITPMPELKRNFKVVTLKGFVYVVGGIADEKLSLTVWRYSPHSNLWTKVAPMLKTAASFALAALGGVLYATGGPNHQYTMQKYDPDLDMWCFAPPMQVVRLQHCMVAFQNKYLVVIGGNTTTTNSLYSVEKYDPKTKTWSYMPQLNIGRIESSAVALEDKIYVVGGYSGSSPPQLNSCEVYSSSTNEWSLIAPTSTPRRDAGITIYHSKVFVLGGNAKKQSANFEHYSEETNTWKKEDCGYYSSFCQCCTVLLSGRQICELYES